MSGPESNHEPDSVGRGVEARPPLRGDETELFVCHADRLIKRVASQVSAPHHTVEDACSFAWVQLLRYPPEDRDQVLAWLTRVAVREVWRLTERERRAEPATDCLEQLGGEDVTFEERVRAMERLTPLAHLRPDERQLIVLQAAGWSLNEIAEATGHSWRAVCRRLKRAAAISMRPMGRELNLACLVKACARSTTPARLPRWSTATMCC